MFNFILYREPQFQIISLPPIQTILRHTYFQIMLSPSTIVNKCSHRVCGHCLWYVKLQQKMPISSLGWSQPAGLSTGYRKRIYTEEKAKVVAASWGTELLQHKEIPDNIHKMSITGCSLKPKMVWGPKLKI